MSSFVGGDLVSPPELPREAPGVRALASEPLAPLVGARRRLELERRAHRVGRERRAVEEPLLARAPLDHVACARAERQLVRVRALATQRAARAQTLDHLRARLEPMRAHQTAQHRAKRLGIERLARRDGGIACDPTRIGEDVHHWQLESLPHLPVVQVVPRCDLHRTFKRFKFEMK